MALIWLEQVDFACLEYAPPLRLFIGPLWPEPCIMHLNLCGNILLYALFNIDLIRRSIFPVPSPLSTPGADGIENEAEHVESRAAGAHREEHRLGRLGLLDFHHFLLLTVTCLIFSIHICVSLFADLILRNHPQHSASRNYLNLLITVVIDWDFNHMSLEREIWVQEAAYRSIDKDTGEDEDQTQY